MTDKDIFLKYCIENLDLEQEDNFETYFASVPICVINSIYSINTKYQAVLNVIENFCNHFKYVDTHPIKGQVPFSKEQVTVTEVLQNLKKYSYQEAAETIFCNRQRTSTKNGILKAEACFKFLELLHKFKVETFQDISKILNNEDFEESIKKIPGQRSGISLKYFFMLTGSSDLIKPDRMIHGFIKEAIGKQVDSESALRLIKHSVSELRKKGFPKLTIRQLDNIIWNYQRS
jgi:hypothetical protein